MLWISALSLWHTDLAWVTRISSKQMAWFPFRLPKRSLLLHLLDTDFNPLCRCAHIWMESSARWASAKKTRHLLSHRDVLSTLGRRFTENAKLQMGHGWHRWQASLAGVLEREIHLFWCFLRSHEPGWKVVLLHTESALNFERLKQNSFCASSVDSRLILARHRLALFGLLWLGTRR